MHANGTEPGGTIVPTLRYRDVPAAIDWLCKAFGFAKHLVVEGEDGTVRYAELTFGTGMIMVGPVEDSTFAGLMAQPADTGGAETQICYLFVADADAHCARAKAAGAEIVLDIEEEGGAGRGYSCRDPEGHVWNFGTYDPWRRSAQVEEPGPPPARVGLARLALAAGLAGAAIVSAAVVAWALGLVDRPDLVPILATSVSVGTDAQDDHDHRDAIQHATREIKEQLAKERTAKDAAERAVREVRAQLARERAAREDAERAVREARESHAKSASDPALEDVRAQLGRERSALQAAERATDEARQRLALAERSAAATQEQLAAERAAREAAERMSQQAQEQLAKERTAREAADRAAKEAREEEARERAAVRRAPRPRPYPQPTSTKSFINWGW